MWSLDALAASGCDPLIAVVPRAEIDLPDFLDAVQLVEGGETRQRSIFNGLQRVTRDRVVIHDAARPVIDSELIAQVLAALDDSVGAIAAIPVGDTLKRVEGRTVIDTIERDGLWRAQTPQAFRSDVLKEAHDRAAREDIEATDDAALIEMFELGRIAVIEGRRSNIKLTYDDDFDIAEALLRNRR